MITIIKIAWRNVWRNKTRSAIVILSIILGLWAGFFTMALTLGLNQQRMNGAINSYLSHIQIHHPDFSNNFNIQDSISNSNNVLNTIKDNNKVLHYSNRAIITGMGSTAKGSVGLQVIGINPQAEINISNISDNIKSGTYFTEIKNNPVVIGKALAEKLKLDIKKKLYITFVDKDGFQQKIKLKVEGIFKTSSSLFDESTIFIKKTDLEKSLGYNLTHEIALICESIDDSKILKKELNSEFPELKTETWSDLAPELGYANEIMSSFIYIFMGIILLALSFGIINTMLMAILERKRELGMLLSVGMNKKKTFFMIMIETIFLTLVATPIGLLLSYLFISYYGKHGIDLSVVAEGLESLGVGAIIYTYLPNSLYFNITIMIVFVAFLSSILPARRALKLDPAEAVKSI